MAVNTTVSHASPLLNYIPRSAWYTVSPVDQVQPNATYHATNGSASGGASVTFSWWGTGIWIYAPDGPWVGPYRVFLDGKSTEFDGTARPSGDSNGTFALFTASNMPAAYHDVRITTTAAPSDSGTGGPVLGIDHLVFESLLGEGTRIEHSDPACSWAPMDAGVWQIDNDSHSTVLEFGRMAMNFTGAGIAIYGFLDATSAPFSVTVDGRTHASYMPNVPISASNSSTNSSNSLTSSTSPPDSQPILLYANLNLDGENHTLLLENNPLSRAATRMSISYGIVFVAGDDVPTNPSTSDGFPKSQRTTLVLASTLSALGLLLIIIAVWRALVRHRRHTARLADEITARPFLAPPFSPFSSTTSAFTPPFASASGPTSNQNPFASTSTLPESRQPPHSAGLSRREKSGWFGVSSGSGSGPYSGSGAASGRGARGDGHDRNRERMDDAYLYNPARIQDEPRSGSGPAAVDVAGPVTVSFVRTPRSPKREHDRQRGADERGRGANVTVDDGDGGNILSTPRARRARSTDKTAAVTTNQSTRRRHRPRPLMVGSPGQPAPSVPSLPTSARLPPRSPPDVMLGDAYMYSWLRRVGGGEGGDRDGRGERNRGGEGGGGNIEMQLMPPPYRLLDMH
ncbi:hypothetical protein GY45DRAFT_1322190 [Cubamyces sp. BRFM 1775]|nr:hypothetical protein GY45DRAFT_1322190 [Cubamyces sp. BRFM 1775]